MMRKSADAVMFAVLRNAEVTETKNITNNVNK